MNPLLIIVTLCTLSITSCVQKSYRRVVVCTLIVNKGTSVQQAGIRGNDQPLSWRKDYPMKMVKKDSLYIATVVINTGYKFTELKFTVNGEFELQEAENRKVSFSKGDTTYYQAIYNQPVVPN